jgi:fructuronate reductase
MAVTAELVRLSAAALGRVPADAKPLLEPGSVRAGIVHLGLGAFHRAHQAVYTEEAMAAAGDPSWGIIGVAPRSPGLIETIAAQDNLFSVTSLDGHGSETRVVGALAGVRHAPTDPAAIIALLADPRIRVVTLTVTEKAYHQDPATGRLRHDPEILADLTSDGLPRTVPGLLVRGLLARAVAEAGPIALVSCDNLPANGKRLRALVFQALELVTPRCPTMDAPGWVLTNVSFPGTMVDRIVPASTEDTLDRARSALGVVDLAAVAAEPYRQWVIEEDFPGGRPAWERAGAVLTDNAEPYEKLKLRGLNGVHSALAYLGALAGQETIADALTLPHLRSVLERMIAEDIAPSFTPPPGASVVDYGQSVLERFANPAICHRTIQVAMDGSQKLPQRVLHGMLDRRAAGGEPRWAALVVAAWMKFVQGSADDGRSLPLDDPLADTIRSTLDGAGGEPAAVVDALLGLSAVFPAELAADPVARRLILDWYTDLSRHGVRDTLEGIA